MKETIKYQFILHLIVLIWGMTGILGDFIHLPTNEHGSFEANQAAMSFKIVFYRTGIAAASLLLIGLFLKKSRILSSREIVILLGIGGIIALHWFSFFFAIKISTISIGVVCMTLSTLFTSFLEPLIFKRKISPSEIVISIFIIIGIVIIFGFEFQYVLGITFGIISAFLASLFTVLNGKYVKTIPSFKITKFEMLGACFASGIGLLCFSEFNAGLLEMSTKSFVFLLILSLVCTTFAFLVSVWVMEFVTPFTVSVSINMEPIYTIIMALIIYPNQEKMSNGFYLGGGIILIAIFTNAYLKKINRKKLNIS